MRSAQFISHFVYETTVHVPGFGRQAVLWRIFGETLKFSSASAGLRIILVQMEFFSWTGADEIARKRSCHTSLMVET